MLKKIIIPAAVSSLLIMTSCSSKLGALSADNFNVNPNPMVAEGGYVPVTINGTFPEKYMKKKATVTVTPELHASDGTILRGAPAAFQGEKVLGNDQTISYLVGGNYTMKAQFPYTDTYHKSDLYLTFDAKVGKKTVEVPSVKVATGVIATAELYKQAMSQSGGCIAADTFQRVRKERQEASVKFLVNQSQLRQSELKNNSVKEFVALLQKINKEQEAYNLNNVEVKAYASPEGASDFNDKLASARESVSEKYVRDVMKQTNINGDVTAEYTAEDWDGFQQLVAASNIQDKDVILRVLSMYQDPEEREQQIRNMSVGFRELADGILPELRRSRMIINYESVGRSDEQIQNQYVADPAQLSADEILYSATLGNISDTQKAAIYKKCTELYPNDYRAYNNLAALAVKSGDKTMAQEYIAKALSVNAKATEPHANEALLALKSGNLNKAQECLSQAVGGGDYDYALGVMNIAKGNYATAAENLKGRNDNMSALAQILNKDYEGARVTFKQIGKAGDGTTDYLHAIMCARQNNSYAANTYLKDAISKAASWQKYAADDLEFINVK